MQRGGVDVAADHTVGLVMFGFGRQRLLESADEIDRVLHLHLRPFRQRPVGAAEDAQQQIENAVHRDRKVVGLVAEQREPARLCHDQIEHVAMHDQIALAVGGYVDGVLHHFDAAEMRAVIVAQEFVVVAGNVDQPRALARLPQQLLHHIVMCLRPIPRRAQGPAVDNVADQIDRVGFVMAQKIEQFVGLAAARSQMHVGNEKRAKASRGVFRHGAPFSSSFFMSDGISSLR